MERVEQGYTLVEIMLALVITLVVAGALHDVLRSTQRLSRAQAGQAALQANLRAGAIVVANELRELSSVYGGTSAQNDLLRISNATVTYRAMRGVGFLCQPPTATALRIARTGFTGHRDPQPGRDSLYVPVAGDEAITWLPVAITGVSAAAECPGIGPGIGLAIPYTDAVTGLEPGTPVRITEVMELRLYQSEGKSWLGARSVSAGEVIQPLIGPLADGNGFSLEFLNGSGDATLDLTSIRSIRAVLRGSRDGGAGAEQELSTRVTLRSRTEP